MDRIELLEQKIREAGKRIKQLLEKNERLSEQCKKQEKEMDLLHSENQQVRKLMVELDRSREERTAIKHKCEKLLARLKKMNV